MHLAAALVAGMAGPPYQGTATFLQDKDAIKGSSGICHKQLQVVMRCDLMLDMIASLAA